MFSPVVAARNIKEEYIDYISTLFNISDQDYAEQFKAALHKEGVISKGPYLDISDSYATGSSIENLILSGEVSRLFRSLEGDIPDKDKELQIQRKLYLHQEQALRKTNQNQNLIVTTGTGSGKTECFILPIINHLLREVEAGTLTDGVRAILIYPMNALANDQMKRLRSLLKSYPDITFGVYNSSTQPSLHEGITEYGKIYKDSRGYPLTPLPNELISRDQMQQTPPHILVTNYAMLEYMMLRPKDDLVFSGAKLKYLVLDEAHVYRGTTGMETSLLLKRLKARISEPSKVIHILTSATLGGKEADEDIVKFASTLCNAHFNASNIIRSKSVIPSYPESSQKIPLSLFADLADPKKSLNEIVEDYGMHLKDGQEDSEFLYDLCLSSDVYRKLRSVVTHPLTIREITSELKNYFDVQEQDIINIVTVASQAGKNKSPLIRARYHMFVKTTEGAYITLGKIKQLSLNRNLTFTLGDEEYKMFECAVCDDCGRIAVVGVLNGGKLEFANNSHDPNVEYYLLKTSKDVSFDDLDEDIEDSTLDISANDFVLCSKCGEIAHESLKSQMLCSCGEYNLVKVFQAKKSLARGEAKCPSCSLGVLRAFYLSYSASTAVLGTSLFEELPESEKVLKSKQDSSPTKKHLFSAKKNVTQLDVVKRKRQFLSFSDSRGEAAFFASYMTASYKEFLRRRGIWHIVDANREDMAKRPWEIKHFVDELTSYFDSCRTFAEPGEKDSANLTAVSRKNAWIAILNEMVNARRSTSLVALGIIKFNYKGNTDELMSGVAEEYHQSLRDVKALFDLLVMDIVYHGAIEGSCDLTDDEREYVFFTSFPKRVKRCKDADLDKKKSYLLSWSSFINKRGKLQSNGRLVRVMRVLGLNEFDANDLLQMYWDEVLCEEAPLSTAGNSEYYLSTEQFTISSGTESIPLYVCDVCGKTTMCNCKDACTTLKCTGHLKQITHQSVLDNNHYAKLYCSSLMQPLHIKEHTAQLGREEQQKYQEMFVNKEINALSCSTTFEMGVDVGDLETVYLRNIPPSPANYVQRAGRAGRGRNAAAFSLTYSKLSSHDFTYYKNPESLIMGKIGVPLFTVRNEKVILRHIFAVALSSFFATFPDVYNSNNADVLLNEDGFERLCSYLSSKPKNLKQLLEKSIPEDMHSVMGISDYSWIDKLTGIDGVLTVAVSEFRSTVQYYTDEISSLLTKGLTQEAAVAEKKLWSYRRGKEDHRGRNELIEFLVRNNVLPKYGFPVDTVELYQNSNAVTNKKLQMVRDLQLAISEYAPDSQIVADGKLYTSRYIRKLPQNRGLDWETLYIAKCEGELSSCGTWNCRILAPSPEGEKCVSCQQIIPKKKWRQAIEPRKGFVADDKPRDVPMRRPEKMYRSEDVYIGDTLRQVIQKHSFVLENGSMFQLETSINDSLMVVCNDDFYVCPNCGYAESVKVNKSTKGFNAFQRILKKKHTAPWGKVCEVGLVKNKLCHVFRTDVVHIIFSTIVASDYEIMISVMYSLLEALSLALDIERNDIKGCLHKISYGGILIYSIVLYDAVAGGAGHVRRMVTDDGVKFQQIVSKAIEITKGCNCSPSCYSCLRNYYNQNIHDKLNRKSAYTFLEDFSGSVTSLSNEEFERFKLTT